MIIKCINAKKSRRGGRHILLTFLETWQSPFFEAGVVLGAQSQLPERPGFMVGVAVP